MRSLLSLLKVQMDNCVTCNRALRRARRHVLSEGFLESRRDFVEMISQLGPLQEVCINFKATFY